MSVNEFKKREVLKYTGDTLQLFGVKDYTLNGGRSQGVRALEVINGSGLMFTVLPDKGMDIAWLSVNGKNCSYFSKTGILGSQYYSDKGADFLRSFHGGFLTTCGLRNVGAACTDDGEELGTHGRISNSPAEDVCHSVEWIDDKPVIKLKGRMREARVFGENLVLCREITCKCGENKFSIEDTVENYGFRTEPLEILYHMNLGYPLLDEDSYLVAPVISTIPKDKEAQGGLGNFNVFQKPAPDYAEQVFYHDLKADARGDTVAALVNEKLQLAVAIRINKNQLFNLAQWKQMGEGEYVLGIEPCNCYSEGRAHTRSNGKLQFIKPGEVRKFNVDVELVEGKAAIEKLKAEIRDLKGE